MHAWRARGVWVWVYLFYLIIYLFIHLFYLFICLYMLERSDCCLLLGRVPFPPVQCIYLLDLSFVCHSTAAAGPPYHLISSTSSSSSSLSSTSLTSQPIDRPIHQSVQQNHLREGLVSDGGALLVGELPQQLPLPGGRQGLDLDVPKALVGHLIFGVCWCGLGWTRVRVDG